MLTEVRVEFCPCTERFNLGCSRFSCTYSGNKYNERAYIFFSIFISLKLDIKTVSVVLCHRLCIKQNSSSTIISRMFQTVCLLHIIADYRPLVILVCFRKQTQSRHIAPAIPAFLKHSLCVPEVVTGFRFAYTTNVLGALRRGESVCAFAGTAHNTTPFKPT